MIQIIPSIAIRKGNVVKMRRGNPLSEKEYNENPLDLAKRFQDHGIEVVHLVDLNGAEEGAPKNYHVLEAIAGHTTLKIDFTGGVSNDGDVGKAFEYGAAYITAASVAITNRELFASWIVSYGREKITLGADVENASTRKVAFRGWQQKTELTLFDHLHYFYERGLKYAKVTDVSRDGVMEGPPIELYEEIMKRFPELKILASGGVRNIQDIEQLNSMGIFAVIFGTAFYEGSLRFKDLEKFLVNNQKSS